MKERKHQVLLKVTFDEPVSKSEATRVVREHFEYSTPARSGPGFEIKRVSEVRN